MLNASSFPVSHSVPAHANATSSGSAGLAAGVTVLLLLLLIVPGGVLYKYHGKIRSLQFGQRRPQKKEEYSEEPQEAFQPYTSMQREQPVAQAPIYENLTRSPGYDRAGPDACSRSPGEPEEDVYLTCDAGDDDAIYGNDPACGQDEDVYIMPDS